MTQLEILTKARALISEPENWCTHAQGRTVDGAYINPWDGNCKARCALGAVSAVVGRCVYNNGPELTALAKRVPGGLVAPWNNCHSHQEVLALFDSAIAELREDDERKTDISIFQRMLDRRSTEPVR